MKIFICLISGILLFACTSQNNERSAGIYDSIPEKDHSATQSGSQVIIGERIDGPANIRDTINGEVLFSLDDNTLVTCTPLYNDWFVIALNMELNENEYGLNSLKKGREIKSDGKKVGEILSDLDISPWKTNTEVGTELIGYTHKDNIKPETIIEPALLQFIQNHVTERSYDAFKPFIKMFGLKEDHQFTGLTIYYNYENWIEDPSPMYRIVLIFEDGLCIGILHSRPMEIPETTDYKLSRGFICSVYKDYDKPSMIVKMFDDFLNSVD